jgi:pimeloyl-ACP methyl ester carboxylesterase
MAHDVISWLDRHQIDKAVLVGHSMGGKVAQAVALLYPHRVDGLVVLDIAPVRYAREADPSWKAVGDIVSVLASLEVQPGASRSHVDQQLRSTVPDPALRAFCLTNLDPKAGRWKIPLDTIASNLHHLADFDLSSAAQSDGEKQHHQYLGDAFFIHGGQSRFVRSSHIPTIASYFPNHLLTTVRGAGHWIHAEAPDDTTALLKKFLDR